MLLVEGFNNGNDVNSVDTAGTRVSEDSDENVFLNIERARVKRKLPAFSFEKNPICYFGSH